MNLANNAATVETLAGDYRIVVTIEHPNATTISQDEAKIVSTKNAPTLIAHRLRLGG